ncbi:MAG: winged helix-turn-helix domain-containing protein, partial [Fimbriimonadaceae bacterium]|nr:winged helix-turn-helix domain-containing protein [Alphaproteobacteria bacterium]
ALIGSLIGDPARANILTALMSGRALTASELASEAGVTVQTASSHLGKLEHGGLITQRKQGRHRYFKLTDDDVGDVLEGLMGLAARRGHMRVRTGPKDPALREARVCYNHLAGMRGVQMLAALKDKGLVVEREDDLLLTAIGEGFVGNLGIDIGALTRSRRPMCKSCLDWSERRSHLAGALGTALLQRIYDLDWAKREKGSRAITFTSKGQHEFDRLFTLSG